MTVRRKQTARRRTAVSVRRLEFKAPFPDLFRLAGIDWTAPATVLVRQGSRTATFVADYRMADQTPCRLTVRIDLRDRSVLAEEMSMTFRVRGRK